MNSRYIFPKLTVVILLFLTACIPGGMAISPESAATQELIQNHEAIPDSIRIYQTQPWRGNSVVLAGYRSNQNNEPWSCEAVIEMQRNTLGWRVSGSGTGCSSPPNTEPVTFGSGSQGIAPDALSYAHGLVILSAAETVEITWQDGVAQRVPVVNGSYLALRDGSIQMIARVEVLDTAEAVIHEIEIMPDVQKLP